MINTGDIATKLQNLTEHKNAGYFKVSQENSNIGLYPHQSDAIRSLSHKILSTDTFAGLLVLPTGGGKTLTAAYWLMRDILDKGGKIVWLAHRHELLNQAQRGFEKVCCHDITKTKKSYNWRVISGQHDKPVNIKPTDDIIIASEYRRLIENVKQNVKRFRMLGLTATPFRTADNEQGLLKKLFTDDIVYGIDLRELINRGILSEPIFESVATGVNMAELFAEHNAEDILSRIANESFFDIDTIGAETAKAIAENRERNNAIVSEYVNNREKYKQTIVFALNVDMAITLSKLFNDRGIKTDYVVSSIRDAVTGLTISDRDNELKIKKFKNGELEVLTNVNILIEGFDEPKVQSVFLTRPTKSTILMTQMVGRALRGERAGGTKDAYIVSFIDNWKDHISWVNPEQLFIDDNVDFTDKNAQTQKSAVRLVSIAKMEEFAKLASDTLDKKVAGLEFSERIPVGIYRFTYLVEAKGESEEDVEKLSNILVYDCMLKAYEQFLSWLQRAEERVKITEENIGETADFVDTTLFGEIDLLLGYRKQDIIDIIRYYQQTGEVPVMIKLMERSKFDISAVARHIVEKDLRASEANEYISNEWSCADSRWQAFFGFKNQTAFRKAIAAAQDRILHEEDHAPPVEKPLTVKESIQIQDLTVYEIRQRFPDLGEKLAKAVYEKFTGPDGYYFCAKSDYRSKRKLYFQIDHIVPMSKGGKTTLDNLQLLARKENLIKSNKLEI
jgi:superfamily II DNA or RNA helicase